MVAGARGWWPLVAIFIKSYSFILLLALLGKRGQGFGAEIEWGFADLRSRMLLAPLRLLSTTNLSYPLNHFDPAVEYLLVDFASSSEPMTQQVNPSWAGGIHLRPVTESDLPILFEHQREPEANEMAAFPARDRDAFMAHWTKILGDETLVAMTVVVDGCVAGHVGCWTQDGQRLVGYWIGKEYWGKGVATQMLSQFLRLVADRPLHAHVAKQNVASIRVLEKCGFAICGKATAALGEPADGIEELVYVIDGASLGDA